jgi:hypothetical protein
VLAVLLRVEYLMTKRGALDPTITAHGDKVIRYVPQSPLSRQQAGEDVAQANQVLTMFRGAMDPQTSRPPSTCRPPPRTWWTS